MRLRVLGPLEVWSPGDTPLSLGGRRQELLLALLCAEANRPVPTRRLVDLLWPEEGPRDPMAALHSQVWRLRRTLAAAGLTVERREPGYLLKVAPADVDALAFEALVDGAATGTADPATLSDLLTTGLGWWRGEPYAGLHEVPALRRESGRLREVKLSWLERAAERLLEAGDPGTAATFLHRAVAEAPLRERCRELLIDALAAEGRTADAVGQFQAYRTLLAEETGLDPGPAVRDAYQRLLSDGGSRAGPVPARLPPLPVTPVPEPVSPIVGREADAEHLCQLLGRGHRLITLTGPGGVGKTRLAVELARRKWDGEAAFVDLSGVGAPEEVPDAFARALGVSLVADDPVDDLAGNLGGRVLLLVVDNFEQVLTAGAALGSLLSRCAGLTAVVTSRERLAVPGEVEYPVRPLTVPAPDTEPSEVFASAAAALFLERLPDPTLLGADDADAVALRVGRLCRQLGGLPLAIELAAALVRHRPVAEVFDRLVEALTGPHAEVTAGPLDSAIRWSYERLREPDQRVLRRLGVFRGRFDLPAARAVGGGDTGRESTLDRLVGLGLLHAHREPAGTRYSVPGIISAYLDRRHPDPAERAVAEAAHLRHHATACRDPRFLDADLLARVDAGYPDFLRALRHGMGSSAATDGAVDPGPAAGDRAGTDDEVYDLAVAMLLYWLWRDRPHSAAPWLDRITSRFAGSPVRLARVDILRGAFLRNRGRGADEAARLGERAAAVLAEAGDREWTVTANALLAALADDRGDTEETVRRSEAAVRVARAGAPRRLCEALGYLACALAGAGRATRAVAVAREALALLDDVESLALRTATRLNAGQALVEAGQAVVAREVLTSGLGDRHPSEGAATYFVNLGWAYLATAEPAASLRWFQRYLAETAHSDQWRWTAEAVAGCACALYHTGRLREAALALGGAERILDRLGLRVSPWIRGRLEAVYTGVGAQPHGHDLVHAGAQLTVDAVVELVRAAAPTAPGGPPTPP